MRAHLCLVLLALFVGCGPVPPQTDRTVLGESRGCPDCVVTCQVDVPTAYLTVSSQVSLTLELTVTNGTCPIEVDASELTLDGDVWTIDVDVDAGCGETPTAGEVFVEDQPTSLADCTGL
ncbi:MAG: hypothetical protein RIT81_20780 [Deltaproteobacteria bacterium]